MTTHCNLDQPHESQEFTATRRWFCLSGVAGAASLVAPFGARHYLAAPAAEPRAGQATGSLHQTLWELALTATAWSEDRAGPADIVAAKVCALAQGACLTAAREDDLDAPSRALLATARLIDAADRSGGLPAEPARLMDALSDLVIRARAVSPSSMVIAGRDEWPGVAEFLDGHRRLSEEWLMPTRDR